jgi:hypothetical protein
MKGIVYLKEWFKSGKKFWITALLFILFYWVAHLGFNGLTKDEYFVSGFSFALSMVFMFRFFDRVFEDMKRKGYYVKKKK